MPLEPLPREIAFHGVLLPTLMPVFLLAVLLTWALDRLLAASGLYCRVWHPNLLRMSLFACVFAALALTIYP